MAYVRADEHLHCQIGVAHLRADRTMTFQSIKEYTHIYIKQNHRYSNTHTYIYIYMYVYKNKTIHTHIYIL